VKKNLNTITAAVFAVLIVGSIALAERKKDAEPTLPPPEAKSEAAADVAAVSTDGKSVIERIWTNKSEGLGKVRFSIPRATLAPPYIVDKKTALGGKPQDTNESITVPPWRPMIDGRIGKRVGYESTSALSWETEECDLCELYESNPGMFLHAQWRRYLNLEEAAILCDGVECRGKLLAYRTQEEADKLKAEGGPEQEVGAGYINFCADHKRNKRIK
jgi:hypothetical protein